MCARITAPHTDCTQTAASTRQKVTHCYELAQLAQELLLLRSCIQSIFAPALHAPTKPAAPHPRQPSLFGKNQIAPRCIPGHLGPCPDSLISCTLSCTPLAWLHALGSCLCSTRARVGAIVHDAGALLVDEAAHGCACLGWLLVLLHYRMGHLSTQPHACAHHYAGAAGTRAAASSCTTTVHLRRRPGRQHRRLVLQPLAAAAAAPQQPQPEQQQPARQVVAQAAMTVPSSPGHDHTADPGTHAVRGLTAVLGRDAALLPYLSQRFRWEPGDTPEPGEHTLATVRCFLTTAASLPPSASWPCPPTTHPQSMATYLKLARIHNMVPSMLLVVVGAWVS
jgi:hypothetical protein